MCSLSFVVMITQSSITTDQKLTASMSSSELPEHRNTATRGMTHSDCPQYY